MIDIDFGMDYCHLKKKSLKLLTFLFNHKKFTSRFFYSKDSIV